ncbi:MAG: 3-dehydroquinate synthase [Clostridiales Family XIII bacterium]|jgi:3-dehydroquinate synthase|nr:3-dehydroquinate synthase [Clostridiales Family XIII bacterium]
MKTLTVPLGARSYDILIGNGLISRAGQYLRTFVNESERVVLISDEHVYGIYEPVICTALSDAGIEFDSFILPPGEETKNIDVLAQIFDWLGEDGRLGRQGLIIAFGGGVIGDLAGFAAACWMRGVRFIQIPTTLLAQVDSSVGGKTAIDTQRGKNLVGAFHQPSYVLIDTGLLDTLPPREYGAGMAEVIKYGAIASAGLFDKLAKLAKHKTNEQSPGPGHHNDIPEEIIYECLRIKSDIVAEDEFDTGRRMILNFGHTFGHAIELKYGFDKYNHGEGVAAGMIIAADTGEKLGVTKPGTKDDIINLLSTYGLDIREDSADLIQYIKNDKKSGSSFVDLVLLTEIGEAVTYKIDFERLETVLNG